MVTEFSGIIDKILYRNEKNGYTKFTIKTTESMVVRNQFNTVTCKGVIPECIAGMPVQVKGDWIGTEFVVNETQKCFIGEQAAIDYISGVCNGIGKKTAERIIDTLKENVFEVLTQSNASVLIDEQLPFLRENQKRELLLHLNTNGSIFSVLKYMAKYGGTYSQSIKLTERFKKNPLNAIKKHPYLVGWICEFPYELCENIAYDEGFDASSEERIKTLALYSIKKLCEFKGHTYVLFDEILHTANYISENGSYKLPVPKVLLIDAILKEKEIVIEQSVEPRFYLKKYKWAEESVANSVFRLQSATQELPYSDSLIEAAETACNVKYQPGQKQAFRFLKSTGIKVLTGGPGTGKTTVIRGLIFAYQKMFPYNKISLCAPTGKAAQRIEESTGMPATTAHKLLEFKPYGDNEVSVKDQSDPFEADLLIMDESSMTDIELMALFLAAIKNNSLVIIVGDKDQLPSVGPGQVLSDFITSGAMEVCMLTSVMRQGEESEIVVNAKKVNNGELDLVTGESFKIIKVATEKEAFEKLNELAKLKYNHKEPFKTQLLAPSYKGEAGVTKMNETVQDMVSAGKDFIIYGKQKFCLGDKVMFLHNSYEHGYCNGDTGLLVNMEFGEITIQTGKDRITVEKGCLDDLTLAYSSTIHKSQGSENDCILIYLPETPKVMLKRKLLYTAITRAKKEVIIVSVGDALETAIINHREEPRHSGLLNLLKSHVMTFLK